MLRELCHCGRLPSRWDRQAGVELFGDAGYNPSAPARRGVELAFSPGKHSKIN
ncbi:MAG: hypothetical protein ISS70_01740 [Phycisphaerae bacterium]|nr:hypothetical protein [Phycisphaerae bacterium]